MQLMQELNLRSRCGSNSFHLNHAAAGENNNLSSIVLQLGILLQDAAKIHAERDEVG